MTALRSELPPLPVRLKKRPVHRGYPVPWFVGWVDGVPDFRVMDGEKFARAIHERLCWVCGQPLGAFLAFNIGPMCAINRISSEPPAHRDCAVFAARACPFLTRPHMARRPNDLPDGCRPAAGVMLLRNPGVALVWVTRSYEVVKTEPGPGHVGSVLLLIGEPTEIQCFAEGRHATRDEVRASVESGYPSLVAAAEAQDRAQRRNGGLVRALEEQLAVARPLLGIA